MHVKVSEANTFVLAVMTKYHFLRSSTTIIQFSNIYEIAEGLNYQFLLGFPLKTPTTEFSHQK